MSKNIMEYEIPNSAVAIVGILAFCALIVGSCAGCPHYNVWQKGLKGEAALARAEWNRQIRVEEAGAKMESAKYLAEADTIRATHIARSNEILGQSLKDNQEYLAWLRISNLDKEGTHKNQILYVATEGMMPIVDSRRARLLPEDSANTTRAFVEKKQRVNGGR
ncbi:MAG: hypothetical protein FWD15_01970 [Alphaproteobacteria bacterium]|nr:hypothetical protein [Alphaproteobacteria bacterium]